MNMRKQEIISRYGSLALAYMGDAVFELEVRLHLLENGALKNGAAHIGAKGFVSAHAQSGFLEILEPHLESDELAVVRRGRNAKPHSRPRGADACEYSRATAFEALWGYLFLAGDYDRLSGLFEIIISKLMQR